MSRSSVSTDDLLSSDLYQTLHRIVTDRLRGHPRSESFRPTAVLHETYLKLADRDWESESHFVATFAIAAQHVMHDAVQKKLAKKRGGGWRRVDLDDLHLALQEPVRYPEEFLLLSEALDDLRTASEAAADSVLMHFFLDLQPKVIAGLTGVSRRAVEDRIKWGKVWLHRRMSRMLVRD